MSSRERTYLREPERLEPARRGRSSSRATAAATPALHAADLARPATLAPAAIGHLQRAAGNDATSDLVAAPDELDLVPGPGEPLDASLAARIGASYGADFSSVRVHRGPEARASADALQARAYTIGDDIVAGEGPLDDRTMAHELAHVVQQRQGPVDGRPMGGVRVSDPGDRFERAADTAATAAGGPSAQLLAQGAVGGALAAGTPTVQGSFFDDLLGGAGGLLGGVPGLGAVAGGVGDIIGGNMPDLGSMAGGVGDMFGGVPGLGAIGGAVGDIIGGNMPDLGGLAGGIGQMAGIPGLGAIGSGIGDIIGGNMPDLGALGSGIGDMAGVPGLGAIGSMVGGLTDMLGGFF